jgi:hypothetical protein
MIKANFNELRINQPLKERLCNISLALNLGIFYTFYEVEIYLNGKGFLCIPYHDKYNPAKLIISLVEGEEITCICKEAKKLYKLDHEGVKIFELQE